MLARKTVKNQITLPKEIADQFPGVEYFEVKMEDHRIILEPLRQARGYEVREKLSTLKISEADITDAVARARKGKK